VNAKITIRKILFIAMWLCIGGGMLTLLLAAIGKKNDGVCKAYEIFITGSANNHFVDEKDVEQTLLKNVKGTITGKAIALFDLHKLEQNLEHNSWINEAQLYFDNKDVLHVSVSEKEPVARVFTSGSNSFYIDSVGNKIPLSDKLSARVPVFTGFPDKKKWDAADSSLLNDIKRTAIYINSNPFWSAQVAQIYITAERNFEMIPVVGNHIVKLGNGENINRKFNRLMVFYKQVLRKTGFDKYKVIDVQFKGQVVVSKYAGNPRVDSIQLRRNVEKMLRQSIEAETDAEIKVLPVIQKLESDPDLPAATANSPVTPEDEKSKPVVERKENPKPVVRQTDAKATEKIKEKPPVKPAAEEQKPKAVMPPKETNEQQNDNN